MTEFIAGRLAKHSPRLAGELPSCRTFHVAVIGSSPALVTIQARIDVFGPLLPLGLRVMLQGSFPKPVIRVCRSYTGGPRSTLRTKRSFVFRFCMTVDAFDITPEMLEKAKAKGLCRDYILGDLTKPIALPDAVCGAMVSCRTFTHGHIGPECLPEWMRITRPGALIVCGTIP